MKFFEEKCSDLSFEWNAARNVDWPIIKHNFVAAYIHAYKDSSLEELQFSVGLQQQATNIWEKAYQDARNSGFAVLRKRVLDPLKYYLSHEAAPMLEEEAELEQHFADAQHDISQVRDKLIKLIMLQHYFEKDFKEEKQKIATIDKKIDYLIVRFHERPIAFFASEFNYKSGRIYLRFVTIKPAFHRLGLGKVILRKIARHYPGAQGFELYTRKANAGARAFYEACRFKYSESFDFTKPDLTLPPSKELFFPADDATDHKEAFVALYRNIR